MFNAPRTFSVKYLVKLFEQNYQIDYFANLMMLKIWLLFHLLNQNI